ncbi:MAG: glycosyltransferase family 1 protein [Zavarzinella sp.]
MKILLATDAWRPQVNGVVRTWETSIHLLEQRGHEVLVLHPGLFRSFPAPRYPEIRLALPSRRQISQAIASFQPDVIHVATEGPIGLAVRGYCIRRNLKFTTTYHSRFPEYLNQLLHVPLKWGYRFMRWFHDASSTLMVATPSLENELNQRGFKNLRRWSRGVDLSLFSPGASMLDYPRPIMLYAGRVSKEKNIEAFLQANVPGTKIIVGDGPHRKTLEANFPNALFLGYRKGAALADLYRGADLFVFPSRTDTFGLVMIEAMACGTPVAGYPVTGPVDIVTHSAVGALHDDLEQAISQALRKGDRTACIAHAQQFNWERCTDQLLSNFHLCNSKE